MNKIFALSLLLTLTVFALAACSSSSPVQIAASPKEKLIAQYPSQQITIVYHAYIELKVSNVDNAAERAMRKAYDYGGYLASSQSWYVDGRKVTTLELAVPTNYFDSLRIALHNLGSLVSESITGEAVSGGANQYFSTITVQFQPKGISVPPIDTGGWQPLNTIENAFRVFLTIFGFLADILIWAIIVGGPFFLIYLFARLVMRRLNRPHNPAP